MLPNVLWIFSDQHRARSLGCYGDPNAATENLDALACAGARFDRAFSNTPLCSPFRASLLTGQHSTTHGVTKLHIPLLERRCLLPLHIKKLGYHTSYMGKWHIAGGAAPCPFVSPWFRPGWDEWLGWENSNDPYQTMYSEGDVPDPKKILPGYQTDALTDLTLAFIRRQPADRPWFHVLSVEPPHPPNTPPEPYAALYRDRALTLPANFEGDHEDQLRLYYGQIHNLDDNVGRILQCLMDCSAQDNTIVFYFSDHGDLMGSHARMGKMRPELESAQIPLIICWPGRIEAGKVVHTPAGGVDIMPTLLGLLGGEIPKEVEGEDLSAVVLGARADENRDILMQIDDTNFIPRPDTHCRGIFDMRYSYGVFEQGGAEYLYDDARDPEQLHNLAGSGAHAALKNELRGRLLIQLERRGDAFADLLRP